MRRRRGVSGRRRRGRGQSGFVPARQQEGKGRSGGRGQRNGRRNGAPPSRPGRSSSMTKNR
jgi:hypothetical protein